MAKQLSVTMAQRICLKALLPNKPAPWTKSLQQIMTENVISGWWIKGQPNLTIFIKITLGRYSWVLLKYQVFAKTIPLSG